MYRSSLAELDIMGRGAANVEMVQEAAADTFGVCFMFLTQAWQRELSWQCLTR